MPPQMKGLVQFITDIRNAREQDEENQRIQSELIHIQKQFQQTNLSSYHRKKYLCKLLYIYLLGNDISFGFQEAIKLSVSKSYSEKFISYIALDVFLQVDPVKQPLIIQSIKNDLSSPVEEFNCLALQFISGMGYDQSLVRDFQDDVFKFIRSPTSSPLLKKKACLALLKLLKSDLSILETHDEWISRIIPLIGSDDFGLSLSATSLVEYIARFYHDSCNASVILSVDKLYRLVVLGECPADYFFYGKPAPWLVCKLFNLLETMIPDATSSNLLDNENLTKIKTIVSTSITNSVNNQNGSTSLEIKNTSGFVLFSALSLAAHIDPSPDQAYKAAEALCSLLETADINSRYLTLNALSKIASRPDGAGLEAISDSFELIFKFLRDRDVSIRRAALDVIYVICNSKNVEKICSDLLEYLSVADFAMKSEVAVKISVLAEKYAVDANWYVVTIMKLLSLAGNFVEDDVWQRLIQITVNNDSIQSVACETAVKYLKLGNYPESLLKAASFLLGEFGSLIETSCPGSEQFRLLYERYFQSSLSSRAMILPCLLKFYSRYPEIRSQSFELFQQESNSFNLEIQQRSLEYLKLITRNDGLSLLNVVTVHMPAFASKTSPLILRLGNIKSIERSFKLPTMGELQHQQQQQQRSGSHSPIKSAGKATPPPPPPSRHSRVLKPPVPIVPLSSTPTSGNSRAATPSSINVPSTANSTALLNGSSSENNRSSASLIPHHDPVFSPNWLEGYYRLVHFDQGIFYENSLIKIIYRLKRERSTLHLQFTYLNKSPSKLSGFTSLINANCEDPNDPSYLIQHIKNPDTSISESGRTVQLVDILVRSKFSDSQVPFFTVSFVSGGMTTLKLKLPTVLIKTMIPGAPLSKEVFFTRWNQIGSSLGKDGECQKIFKANKPQNSALLKRTIELAGFNNLMDMDPNPNNLVCAGILNLISGNSGCLLRLELNPVDMVMIRLTVRCTQVGLAENLVETLSDLLMNES